MRVSQPTIGSKSRSDLDKVQEALAEALGREADAEVDQVCGC